MPSRGARGAALGGARGSHTARMSWDSLVKDVQAQVLGLAAAEAASYYVCTGWQSWLLGLQPGEAAQYARLVEAGLRLALARGEGSYYSWALRTWGRWVALPGPGSMMPGLCPSSYGEHILSMVQVDRDEEDAEPRYLPVSKGLAAVAGIDGTVEVPRAASRTSRCPACADSDHLSFSWEQMHNWVLEEGKWAPVAGSATTDLEEPLRLCFDFSGAPTPAPAALAGGGEVAGAGLYTEPAHYQPLSAFFPGGWESEEELSEDGCEAWLAGSGFARSGRGDEIKNAVLSGSVSGKMGTRLETRLDPESLCQASSLARAAARADRLPGKTVVESAEDAFLEGGPHELLKIMLLRESSGEDEEGSW